MHSGHFSCTHQEAEGMLSNTSVEMLFSQPLLSEGLKKLTFLDLSCGGISWLYEYV